MVENLWHVYILITYIHINYLERQVRQLNGKLSMIIGVYIWLYVNFDLITLFFYLHSCCEVHKRPINFLVQLELTHKQALEGWIFVFENRNYTTVELYHYWIKLESYIATDIVEVRLGLFGLSAIWTCGFLNLLL